MRASVVSMAVWHLFALLLLISDSTALSMAQYLWGADGFARRSGRNFQVGCVLNGSRLIVATSKESWEDAFAKVDLGINGPRTLTAEARDDAGNVGQSAPVKVHLCNVR